MILRRLTTLLVAVPLLHLNAVRADSACASHDLPAAVAVESLAPAHAHHADVPAPSPEDESCDAPATKKCCEALASCTVVIGEFNDGSDDDVTIARVVIGIRTVEAPASLFVAPEPPPPRVLA